MFSKTNRQWLLCKLARRTVIGRMYFINLASDLERYCLHLLLLHVPGATNYEDLRTVEGVCFQTFCDAAVNKGLVSHNQTWAKTLQETVL